MPRLLCTHSLFGRLLFIALVLAGCFFITASKKGFPTCLGYRGEGKPRPAEDIVLPPHVPRGKIVQYIADLCHEWGSEAYSEVSVFEIVESPEDRDLA